MSSYMCKLVENKDPLLTVDFRSHLKSNYRYDDMKNYIFLQLGFSYLTSLILGIIFAQETDSTALLQHLVRNNWSQEPTY